jgi:predicted dehydrogenase
MIDRVNSPRSRSWSRRDFARISALAAATTLSGPLLKARATSRKLSATDKLNIGVIGAGGRGWDNIQGVQTENIVALCDVDEVRAAAAKKRFPSATIYRDFREMLDKERALDAVVVSTPDHVHAVASLRALERGLHVYCEKPLARTNYETRRLRDAARASGGVTQMGQQGHAMEGSRRAVEVIRAGTIGDVSEIHVWTDRPAGWWPQGIERPTETPPVPATLEWDLWLGPAPQRPYNPIYVPFKWRGFWDFGTGAIGDMGVHNLDTAYWALELDTPVSAEVKSSSGATRDCPPGQSIIELKFAARDKRPEVKLTFYDGKQLPPRDLFLGEEPSDNGSLVIGSKGTLFTRTWHGGESEKDMFWLLPRKQFVDHKPPAATLPRTTEHHAEWISACKGGPASQSNFNYASRLTETLLVGLLAVRTGKRIEWDTATMKARGCPEADPYIHPPFRKGWEV